MHLKIVSPLVTWYIGYGQHWMLAARKTARAVLSVLKKQKPESGTHIARVGRQPVTIPKHKVMKVECGQLNKRVLSGSHVVLEPNQQAPWPTGLTIREQLIQLPQEDNEKITLTVENLTDHDLTLCGRTTLGWLYGVDAVYHLEMKSMEDQEPQLSNSSVEPQVDQPSQVAESEPWDPPVDLSHLSWTSNSRCSRCSERSVMSFQGMTGTQGVSKI